MQHDNTQEMSSNRPYLVRAINEWIIDNGLTPHLLVNAEAAGVQVPRQYVEDGRIVLNMSPAAVKNLVLGNEYIEFNARFSGSPFQLCIPMSAVMAVYARENGLGMMFPPEDAAPGPGQEQSDNPRAPKLTLVKT